MKHTINKIYQAYFNDIFHFLLSLSQNYHTAEDLVQETFIRAHLYIETYKGENIKSWLFTIAHHVFIDYYRKHKKMIIKDERYFSFISDKKIGTDEEIIVQEEINEVIRLVGNLPEKHRLAVLLHDIHGFSQYEAANVMNVKQSYFKVLLFRGRQTIRQRRAKHDG
ncbi:sigma-70 family RNA polymerase sigma factor [Ornithinibacillus bavariensis]|uniref:ECF RNA polymerase sigma factor SigM n=1 Tax=Ornithinibacillus bavariensis TaxID=545502 RepID=A0A920C6M1_9BACI|nr:sigma-70 family RNA polymerase sigma factor [Ornithinibacillus bavariensis]GIO25827.1 ECF RNA polymerase sigma factor SigM [Ornithinibacillus bavariensis]HAM79763.1 RNA polymerase subunit sigma-24 [Ornithinibacillus sp.]